MRRSLFIFVLLLAALPAVAEDPALAPRHGVLLLRNGSVIEGEILKSGDRYEVGLKDGEVRVRVADVEFTGGTLSECYEHRRSMVEHDKVDDHLKLAEWCLRHELYSQASRELVDAMVCDASHPKIALLERRLRMTLEGPGEATTSEPKRLNTATAEELDRMVRGMPAGTVEVFTNTIQPMLLNQCSTAGCHGPTSSTSMRLMRVAAGRSQSRRATQRNLHAVIGIINNDSPELSPLLTVPIRPHGSGHTAVFTSKQTLQYKQLVDWAYSVASKQKQTKPAEEGTAEGEWPVAATYNSSRKFSDMKSGRQSGPAAEKHPQGRSDFPASADGENATSKVKRAGATGSAAKSSGQRASAELGGETEDWGTEALPSPRRLSQRAVAGKHPPRSIPKRAELPEEKESADPFDAAEFNERYLGK